MPNTTRESATVAGGTLEPPRPPHLRGAERREQRALITIDGPTAAGKSTLGAALAKALGWSFLDSGLVYRALAVRALGLGLSPEADLDLCRLGGTLRIGILEERLCFDDAVFADLRSDRTADFASKMATGSGVRRVLTDRIRFLAADRPSVVVGRDAGAGIFPEAPLQVFLTASLSVRAERRAVQPGEDADAAALFSRDHRDKCRRHSPLCPTPGATILDTSDLTPSESLDILLRLAQRIHLSAT